MASGMLGLERTNLENALNYSYSVLSFNTQKIEEKKALLRQTTSETKKLELKTDIDLLEVQNAQTRISIEKIHYKLNSLNEEMQR